MSKNATKPKRFRRKLLIVPLVIAGLAIGYSSGVVADDLLGGTSQAAAAVDPSEPRPDIEVNSEGMTFGSVYGLAPDEYPDLIAVAMPDHSIGYIRRDPYVEMMGYNVETLEEAIAFQKEWERRGGDEALFLPAYDETGKRYLGDWYFTGPIPEVEPETPVVRK